MKQFAILIAAVGMIGFLSSESLAQYHGHRHSGTSWGVSIGNGYGSGVTFGQGVRGNSFYGISLNSGYRGGYGGGHYAPAYRPVYRPVYSRPYYGHYGGGHYRGGHYARPYYGGGYGGGCGRW